MRCAAPRASHTQELRKAHPLDAETKRKKINHSIQGLKGPRVSSQLPASNHQPETGKSIYETKPFPLRRVGPELHDAMVIAVRECLLRSAPRSLTAKLTGGIGPTVSSHLSRTDLSTRLDLRECVCDLLVEKAVASPIWKDRLSDKPAKRPQPQNDQPLTWKSSASAFVIIHLRFRRTDSIQFVGPTKFIHKLNVPRRAQ